MTIAAEKKIAEFRSRRSSFRERMKARLKKSSAKERQDALVASGVVTTHGKLSAAYRLPAEGGVASGQNVLAKALKKADPKAPTKKH